MPEDCIVACLDVVGLYTNIAIPESIDAAVDLLRAQENRIDMLGLFVEDIRIILEFILDRNSFEFNGEQYRQRNGLAMGNQLAPPLAILFMSSLEVKVLDSCDCKPLLYKRYIDDIFVISVMVVKHLIPLFNFSTHKTQVFVSLLSTLTHLRTATIS